MALAVGLDRPRLLRGPHPPGGELRRHPRPDLRPGALGGAGRLLALDDLRRDRRPARRGARSPTSTATATRAAVWRGVADEFQRNLKTLDADHQRPAQPEAVLHPAVEDRRPERGDHLQRRQRRPDARPARRDRRRASSSTPRLGLLQADDADIVRSLAGRRRDDQAHDRHRRRLPALQRRRLRRRRRRRPSVGAVEQGHRPRLAGAGGRARAVGARPGRRRRRRHARCRRWQRWAPASG